MNLHNFTMDTNITDNFDQRLWSENVELCYNIFAIILGIPVNCWSLSRYWKLWKAGRANKRVLLGLNLTLSNFSVVLFYCSSKTAWLIYIIWPWGDTACKIRSFLVAFVHHSSSNAIVIIAWEMFSTLYKPLEARTGRRFRSAIMQISCCYILAAACSCPQVITWGEVEIPEIEKFQCVFLFGDDQLFLAVYELCHVISVFYTPLLLITLCYVGCGVVLGRQLKRRESLQEQSRSSVSSDNGKRSSSIITFRSSGRSKTGSTRSITVNNARVKRKFFKVSAAVIFTYIICWLPYQTLSLWSIVLEIQMKNRPDIFQYMYFVEALMLSTVFINPFLYTYHGL